MNPNSFDPDLQTMNPDPQNSAPQQPNTFNDPYAEFRQAAPPPSNKKKIVLILIGGLLVITLLAVLLIVLLRSTSNIATSSEPLETFSDPNFSMDIPADWTGDASYTPGSTFVLFYSPEDSDDETVDEAYQAILYVGSQDKNRIQNQIEAYEETDNQHLVEVDETFENSGTSYRYVELLVRLAIQPEREIRIATITAQRGDFIINAEVTGNNEYWDRQKDVVPELLKSIVPACESPDLSKIESADALNLCES